MKKSILILVLLTSTMLAQSQCKVKTTFDKFNKSTTHIIYKVDLRKGMRQFDMMLFKGELESGISYALAPTVPYDGCITSKSYMQFLNDKGDIIELKYKGSIKCGTRTGVFSITESQLNDLINMNITDIRVYLDTSSDFDLTDKNKEKLKEALNCILNAGNEATKTASSE